HAALLRGSARGLEIVIDAPAGLDAISDAINARLAEAPTFFRGSDVRIRVEDGPLPIGSLARLEVIAANYELRIVEIGAAKPEKRTAKGTEDGVPVDAPTLAAGSAPTAPRRARSATEQFETDPTTESRAYRSEFDDVPTVLVPPPPNAQVLATALALAPAFGSADLPAAFASARTGISWVSPLVGTEPLQPSLPLDMPVAKQPEPVTVEPPVVEAPPTADQLELALRAQNIIEELEPGTKIESTTRIVVGPVRSGVILDHRGHLIVFGDVNPGAEIRATGNIIVLGRLRGLAHAGIGPEGGAVAGFILSLHLQPQQLRIGRMVARASDGDSPAIPEIAYVTNGSIVVERYQGRLPAGLAESLK
ncbi:MAG: hypothetical protein H0V17_15065, partial [Deltaproteobacteria bacterium]|nr:hypothetical protein [Deltaproteobacteria bacterium]